MTRVILLAVSLAALVTTAWAGIPEVDPAAEKQTLAELRKIMDDHKVPENYKTLIAWLQDPSLSVRVLAADALRQYVAPAVRDELFKMLDDKTIWTLDGVLNALTTQAPVLDEAQVLKIFEKYESLGPTVFHLAALVEISPKTRDRMLKFAETGSHNQQSAVIDFIEIELGLHRDYKTTKTINQEERMKGIDALKKLARFRHPRQDNRYSASRVLLQAKELVAFGLMAGLLEEELEAARQGRNSFTNVFSSALDTGEILGKQFGPKRFPRDDKGMEAVVLECLDFLKREAEKHKPKQ